MSKTRMLKVGDKVGIYKFKVAKKRVSLPGDSVGYIFGISYDTWERARINAPLKVQDARSSESLTQVIHLVVNKLDFYFPRKGVYYAGN